MAKSKANKKPATTTRLQKQTKRSLEAAEEQAAILRAAADQAADSKQPRFAPGRRLLADFFDRVYGWGRDSIFTMPAYSSNSMKRDRWLEMVVKKEPYLYGVLQSVVSIDKNRGWNLIGGRNQVNRFVKILHNFEAAPDLTGWRNGMSNAAQSYYGADLGCVVEIGRIIANGPLAALFTVDPSTCRLTGDIDKPLEYTSGRDGDSKQWGPNDYFRVTSMPSTRESMNGLGFCAMSRCIELAQILVGVFDHDKEQLGAKAPKGILTIAGLTQEQLIEALNDAESDQKAQESRFFSNILALASADGTVTANLVPFSSLPSGGFDQQKFVEMIICGYALALGYDPREFWPISSGSLGGTGTEIENQHRRATTKGGLDFALGFQEKLQDELPDTLEFEIEQRDVNGEISEVDLKQKVVTMINDLRTKPNPEEAPDISFDEARSMLVEFKIIPEEWTETEEPVNVSDTEDNANANNLERERVQRAMEKFPNEEIVIYNSKTNKLRTLASAADTDKRRSFYMPKVLGKGRGPGRPDSPRAVARDINVKKKMNLEKKRQYDGDFPTTQSAYNDAVYTFVRDYLDSSDRSTSYKTAFKRNMVEAFASAVENGVIDGGGELPLEGEEDALLTSAQGAELGNIDSLFDELKDKRDAGTVDPDAEAQARADGYTSTLVGLYNQARLLAMGNKMVTFEGTDGAHPCDTCQWLQGQRHRAKWFVDNGYVPPKGENLDCAAGGHCLHELIDDEGTVVTL
jgi:hypothetical protein